MFNLPLYLSGFKISRVDIYFWELPALTNMKDLFL